MDAVRSVAEVDDPSSGGRHHPVRGLPASLLAVEGKTFAVVALMQREGWLGRDRRRGVVPAPSLERAWPEGVDTSLPRAELKVLARFVDQHPRAIAFWNLVAARRERRRSEAATASHIVSLEAQLLRAYEPAWDVQEFDEEALRQACPPWAEIRARIEEETAHLVRRPRLAPCMLWPALVGDLDRWPALDEARQRAVAHAVFALASVCWSDWFVSEALRRCPGLQPELGSTCAVPPPSPAPPAPAPVPLAHIVERLEALRAELAGQPTQEAVRELLACAAEAEPWLTLLPDRRERAAGELRHVVEALIAQARSEAATPALAWLGPDVLAQVEARWSLAAAGLDTPALRELAHDAVRARQRLGEALGRCAESRVLLDAERASVRALEAALSAAPTLAQRRELEGQRLRLLRALIDAEAGQSAVEDAVLASLSPWGEAFDLGCDYRAALPPSAGPAPSTTDPSVQIVASSCPLEAPESGPGAVALSGDMAEMLSG